MRIESDQMKTLICLTVVGLLFTLAGWLPYQLKSRRMHKLIAQSQSDLGFDRASTQGLSNLANEVGELTKIIDSADKYVPQTTELADLLRELSNELERHSVTDREIQTQPLIAGADYVTIPLNLRFRGSFPSVYGFINEIESMRRLVRVNRLEVHGGVGKGDPLDVSIELVTFSAVSENQ